MIYNYKKQLKWFFVGLPIVVLIFVIIYHASVTRVENLETIDSNYNLESLVNFIKQILPKVDISDVNNTASLNQIPVDTSSDAVIKINTINDIADSSLNRELLGICLAKAEGEWNQLQKHYQDVLIQCINIDLGLNGEKLFSNDECDSQIRPYREKDKKRIQGDKIDCFARYSERE